VSLLRRPLRQLVRAALLFACATGVALAQTAAPTAPALPASAGQAVPPSGSRVEPILGTGDYVKITVFQNPDLSVEARISETGQINFPLVGAVALGGLAVSAAEKRIETMLRDGGFVLKPQVTIQTVQIRSSQISILGQVAKPGRFPIELVGSRVSEMIAAAGGVVPGGADVVTLVGKRDGKPVKLDIDLPLILQQGRADLDVQVENGDIIYVDRAPSFYMYGEVQRPGQLRLERSMTLMQALAQAGGLTARGTERGIKVHRKDPSGAVKILELKMNDPVERDDVIYIKESIF
jgi:polysaccharide export outer membrane protein